MILVSDKEITTYCIASWFLNCFYGTDAILKILYFYLIHKKIILTFDHSMNFLLMASSITLCFYYYFDIKYEEELKRN